MADPFIGVMMLDTAFERIVGDVGNPASYPFATRHVVVPNADPTLIVQNTRPEQPLIDAFCASAKTLEAQGAIGLVTSCGFLIHVQDELAASVHIPVITSALVMAPALRAMHGQRPVGILTASATALGPDTLAAAGLAPRDAIVEGLQGEPAFANVYTAAKGKQHDTVDYGAISQAVGAAAQRILNRAPDVATIVLECANLPTYKALLQQATGRPVFDILDSAQLIWQMAAKGEMAKRARP